MPAENIHSTASYTMRRRKKKPARSLVKRIRRVIFSPIPSSVFGPKPFIDAEYDDGSVGRLLSYYADEVSFTDTELIGLSRGEAHDLLRQKEGEFRARRHLQPA